MELWEDVERGMSECESSIGVGPWLVSHVAGGCQAADTRVSAAGESWAGGARWGEVRGRGQETIRKLHVASLMRGGQAKTGWSG